MSDVDVFLYTNRMWQQRNHRRAGFHMKPQHQNYTIESLVRRSRLRMRLEYERNLFGRDVSA